MVYKCEIREASKELTARERLKYKDTGNSIGLEELTRDGDFLIHGPFEYVVLDIENEKAKDNPNYTKYVVIEASGNSYITGSESFWKAFLEIFNEMKGEPEYSILVKQTASRNYKDKTFITCAIV